MSKTGVVIELAQVIVDDGIAEDAVFQLQRLHNAGVVVALVSQLGQEEADDLCARHLSNTDLPALPVYGLPAADSDRWRWPKAGMLLRAATEHDIDIFNSWVIGSTLDLFKAAAQAGYLGGVLIAATAPEDKCGLQVLNEAQSLADAPRVMIPPQGGCWHDH